jgi:iron only hydrogenase large subunit-like protein
MDKKIEVHADREQGYAKIFFRDSKLTTEEIRDLIKILTDTLFDLEGKGER